jgi:hypothetical protein
VHELTECLDLAQHTRARIHVRNSQELVLLLSQRSLDLIQLWTVADWSFELRSLNTVCFEAVGKRVGKISSVQDQHFLARFSKVRGNLVPAQCARAGDDQGLGGGVGRLEELAQVGQHLTEGIYKRLADVRFAVVAHGLQNFIVELNGARDEQRGVGGLARHVDRFDCLLWLRLRLGLGRLLGFDDVSLVVDGADASLSREGRVQFKEWFRLEVSREEAEARGCSRGRHGDERRGERGVATATEGGEKTARGSQLGGGIVRDVSNDGVLCGH